MTRINVSPRRLRFLAFASLLVFQPFSTHAEIFIESRDTSILPDAVAVDDNGIAVTDNSKGKSEQGLGPAAFNEMASAPGPQSTARATAAANSEFTLDGPARSLTVIASGTGTSFADRQAGGTALRSSRGDGSSVSMSLLFHTTAACDFTVRGHVNAAKDNNGNSASAEVSIRDRDSGLFLFRSTAAGNESKDIAPPVSGVMPAGSWEILVKALCTSTTRGGLPGGNASASVNDCQIDLTTQGQPPSEFHWINPNGGEFDTFSNWDPLGVPRSADIAVFDLANNITRVPILGRNDVVQRIVIRRMNVDLNGPVQVLGTDPSQTSFIVVDGGSLKLGPSVIFSTTDALIGETGPEASVFVSGAGARWISGGELGIGGTSAPGKVVVDQDGFLDAHDFIGVGLKNGMAGTLRVESGGLVQAPDCAIEQGSVQVRGQGTNISTLEVASQLVVGDKNGPGNMLIEAGGFVKAETVFVGDDAGNGPDTITISGVDNGGLSSVLSVDGANPHLNVYGGPGTQVEVKDGGLLATLGQTLIGNKFEVGKVLVHGTLAGSPARWDAVNTIFVGSEQVPSDLIVQDGGRVTCHGGLDMLVGAGASELGRVEVSGSGSSLSTNGTLSVGIDGHGELTIGGVLVLGGVVVESNDGFVGKRSSTGTGTGSGSVRITGTPLTASEWHVTGNCEIGADEPGNVLLDSLPKLGGATLRIDGTLTVGAQGNIAGNGTLKTGHRVVNGGSIGPGLSPGVIVIEGDYEQTAEGTLRMEAAGLNDGQFDVLHVTGKGTLGGTMEVTFLNGYLPKTGDALPFLQLDGEITGNFSQITFPQLAPGFQIKTEMVDGKYQVTALNDGVPLSPKGTFRGLLNADPASHDAAGFFTIRSTAQGGFSARFVLGGRSFALSGKFDAGGKFSKTIPRKGDTPLTVNLELAANGDGRLITGTIVDGANTIHLSADRANAFNAKKSPAPEAGKYTALLQFDSAASDTPQANGIGVVGISTSGAIRFVGALPDGTRLSQGTVLSKSGEWPLYVLLYKKQGSLFGELQFRENAGSDFDGTLRWSRPPTPNDKIQTAGFFTSLPAIGSKYVAPPARPAVLDLPNGATATLSDADLTPALTKSLTLTPPNKFVVLDPGADKLSLSASATNGLLSGRFIHPKTSSSTTVQGVIFQKQNFGSGFFLRPGVIGSFGLQANP